MGTLEIEGKPLADQFRNAFERRDANALRRLARHGAEIQRIVNQPLFAFDSPALVVASGHDELDVVDALLELGADPNRKSDWWAGGFHPLYHANPQVATRLLKAGALPDACAAAAMDRMDLLTDMLARDPALVNQRGGDGQTPLHFAKSRRVAELLLAAGANIDARDVDHRSTPAEWMLSQFEVPGRSRLDVAQYLFDRGAACDIFLAAALGRTGRVRDLLRSDPSLLSLRTGQGEYAEKPPSSYHIYFWSIGANLTPLQTAAKFGQRDTLDFMRGLATPEQQLMVACHEGDAAEARRLVAAHPGMIQRLPEEDARALTDEAWAANAPAARLMLELGFDPALGEKGGTALHSAAWTGSPETVAAILESSKGRALVNAREQLYGGTPLGWCCHGSVNGNRDANHAEVARMLIAAGANVPDDMEGSEKVEPVLDAARR